MEENNLSKEKSSNKKILKGVLIYFLLAVVVTSIYSIYNNTQPSYNNNNNNTQPSCENFKIIASEDFYSENLDIVLEEYNKDSEEFIINLDNIENSFWSLEWSKWVKKDIDLEKIYPYMNYYISNRTNGKNVIKNQGIFLETGEEYKLIGYMDSDKIYFDIEIIKTARADDLTWCLKNLFDSFELAGIFEYEDDKFAFWQAFQDAHVPKELSTLVLPLYFSGIKADIKKPIIYLYPEKEIEVDIKLDGANLITTYPEYHNGWTVTAYPDGTLIDKNGRGYNYLYWEGVSNNFIDMSEGFVVSKDSYIEFLEEKLDYIGLSNKESADFISYWLPYMNEFEYCLVSFQMENYEEQVKLDFSINPDNELRVFVAFKGLSDFVQIEEQDLSYYEDFERTGFTVVEWGGSFIE